jgi:hypothetical protein
MGFRDNLFISTAYMITKAIEKQFHNNPKKTPEPKLLVSPIVT